MVNDLVRSTPVVLQDVVVCSPGCFGDSLCEGLVRDVVSCGVVLKVRNLSRTSQKQKQKML
jgi:hypothetical protein